MFLFFIYDTIYYKSNNNSQLTRGNMKQTNMKEQRIILIDSSAFVYRYYHAYNKIQSQYQGENIEVGALHGYLTYTKKLSEEFPSEHLIHVLDPGNGSAFRKALLPEYKGHREKDPLIERQLELLPFVLDGFQQRWVQKSGVESDDILSTYAHIYGKDNFVLIAAKDKDVMQSICSERPDGIGSVAMVQYVKGTDGKNIHEILEDEHVVEKFGIEPAQVADYLAIVGDVADNIIGLNGVGPKTAAKLLQQYGTIETLIAHADEVKGKTGESLRAGLSTLPLMKKLTSTLIDVELPEIETIKPVVNQTINMQVRELVKAKMYWTNDLKQAPTPQNDNRRSYRP